LNIALSFYAILLKHVPHICIYLLVLF